MVNKGDLLTTIENGMKRVDDSFYSFKYTNCTHDSVSDDNNGTKNI